MSDACTALPGFEELVRTAVDRAGSNDFTGERYTAGILLRDYPETFKSIAAAIFRYNLPNRVIRDLYHCNGATVRGVHDMVMGAASNDGRGRFLMNCRAASTKSIVVNRLLDAIIDKLDDPDVIKKMSVAELTDVLTRLSPVEREKKTDEKRTIDVTPVQPTEDYDAIINGLVEPKKRAALGPSDGAGTSDSAPESVGEDGSERSTKNVKTVYGSSQMSYSLSNSLGNNGTLCNGLCNPSLRHGNEVESRASSRVDVGPSGRSPVGPGKSDVSVVGPADPARPDPAPAEEGVAPPGAGGTRGPSARGA